MRPVLDLLVEATAGRAWSAALAEQARAVQDVSGSCWYAELILSGEAPPVPVHTPIPCAALLSREDVTPYGTLLLWIDEKTGLISAIEYAAIEMADVDHYPRVDELEIDRGFPGAMEICPISSDEAVALVQRVADAHPGVRWFGTLLAWCRPAEGSVPGEPGDDGALVAEEVDVWGGFGSEDRATLERLVSGLDDLSRGACDLGLSGWRDIEELRDDIRLRAEVVGAMDADRLRPPDLEAVDHALMHVLEVAGGWTAPSAVPSLADQQCGCPAGRWLDRDAAADGTEHIEPMAQVRAWERVRWWLAGGVIVLAGAVAMVAVAGLAVTFLDARWTVVLPAAVAGLGAGVMVAWRHRPTRDATPPSTGLPSGAARSGGARNVGSTWGRDW